MFNPKLELTPRSFERFDFDDANDQVCSLQQSSAVLEPEGFDKPGSTGIWLGVNPNRMHLSKEQVQWLAGQLICWLQTGGFQIHETENHHT